MGFRSCFLKHKVFSWKIEPPFLRIRFFQIENTSSVANFIINYYSVWKLASRETYYDSTTRDLSHFPSTPTPKTWHQDVKRILMPTERREHPLRVSRIIKPYLSLNLRWGCTKKTLSRHETINSLQVSNVQKKTSLLVLPKMWRDSHTTLSL